VATTGWEKSIKEMNPSHQARQKRERKRGNADLKKTIPVVNPLAEPGKRSEKDSKNKKDENYYQDFTRGGGFLEE